MNKGAVLSECRKYRFQLWRIWDESKPLVLWVMMNPSTADENENDRTIEKLIRLTKKWGYGGFYVGNIYAYRAKKPADLKKAGWAIAHRYENADHIIEMARKCQLKILAHGNPPLQIPVMKTLFTDWCYLRLTKRGNGSHPLYLPESLTPILFNP